MALPLLRPDSLSGTSPWWLRPTGLGIRDRAPLEEWQFEATTWHTAGEDMRNLTAEIHTFIASVAE